MNNPQSNLPTELRSLKRWIPVRVEETKVPLVVGWQRPEAWRSFEDATQETGLAGFALCEADRFFIIDIDGKALDASEREKLEERFRSWEKRLNTYCERSVSGLGWHIVGRYEGTFPLSENRKFGNVEVYFKEGRCFIYDPNGSSGSLVSLSATFGVTDRKHLDNFWQQEIAYDSN